MDMPEKKSPTEPLDVQRLLPYTSFRDEESQAWRGFEKRDARHHPLRPQGVEGVCDRLLSPPSLATRALLLNSGVFLFSTDVSGTLKMCPVVR